MGSSSSSVVADYIGIESCLDLEANDDIFASYAKEKEKEGDDRISNLRRKQQKWVAEKEFPPPIPLLARTENLACHMPWVLKRYYTNDGRLILREEKVRHHEFFRAERCNGRLTLQLVPLDNDGAYHLPRDDSSQEDDNDEAEEDEAAEEEEGIESGNLQVNDNGTDRDDKVHGDGITKEKKEEEKPVASMENGNVGNANAFNCFNYNRMGTRSGSTCIFEMPVAAMRPIHG